MAKSHAQKHTSLTRKPSFSLPPQLGKNLSVNPDGTSVASFLINLNTLPTPERKYVAELADVIHTSRDIKILFGQTKITGGVRNLLIVEMSHQSVKAFIETVNGVNDPSYEDVATLSNLEDVALTPFTEEPEQTVSLKANLISSVASGAEACFDFYYLSPFSVLKLQTNDKVDIDPVVRVDIHTSLFISVIRKLKETIKDYP